MKDQKNNINNKLYFVEFLRIFFIFFIILGHIINRYPDLSESVFDFFDTKNMQTTFGVEFFFIIGGFFLYKRLTQKLELSILIQKYYFRLLPCLFFIFLICVFFKLNELYDFPLICSLTSGLSIPGEILGWGDWYVSVYFWCSLLYIYFFIKLNKHSLFITLILIYITICIKFHAPHSWMSAYYNLIGSEVIRGIYSIGLGIIASYISEQIFKKKSIENLFFKLLFTIIEIFSLIAVYNYIVRFNHNHFNFFEMELVFCLLLISIDNSCGFISKILNKVSYIYYISRYTYSFFVCHIFFIRYLFINNFSNLNSFDCALFVILGTLFLGVFEYHVVEKLFIKFINKKLIRY